MSDDLHNRWGTNLFVLTKSDKTKYNSQSSIGLEDEFKRIVSKTFSHKFHLQKVCADGSSANIFAIVDSTRGDTGRCFYAAGSYLSSAGSVLCTYATSVFEINSPLSLIRHPNVDDSLSVKKAIIALPYHIHGSIIGTDLETYEDLCFSKMHEKLLLYRVQGRPIMSLFLELILAGNGAHLSDRALAKIAILSKQHDFKIVVDEIMTGGRTGSLLLLTTKSKDFISCVSHVTLGKWCQCGIILVSTEQNIIEQRQQDTVTAPRSSSTSIDLHQIIPYWNKIISILLMAEIRRATVLRKFKCKENDSWGVGAMIYSPIKNNTSDGLNHRLLPMLELTNISCNATKPFNNEGAIFRNSINDSIVNAIKEWNDVIIHDKLTMTSVTENLLIIEYLILRSNNSGNEEVCLSTEEICIALSNQIKPYKLSSMLNDMSTAGLLEYKLIGKKRLRNWVVIKTFTFI